MPISSSRTKPGWSLDQRDPKVIQAQMPVYEWFYRYYFRVKTEGWHQIPPQGRVLLVGSHNGGLAAPDMVMMMYDWFRRFGPERRVYGLMHPNVWRTNSAVVQLAAQMGAIVAHPKMAIAALQSGASVLVYPGGAKEVFRPHSQRHRVNLNNNQAFIKLALRERVPIIPLVSCGAHDTLIILADCYPVIKQLHDLGMPWPFGVDPEVFPLYLGLPWGIALGPLPHIPLPVQIHTRVCPPITFERYGRVRGDRQYVKSCYDQVEIQMQKALDELVLHSSG
jgi:1-acyl-sn-glycerol-3-phosphate acyltransferase